MGRTYPPEREWVPRVFVRSEGFYVINLPADADLGEHATLNPGTLRVEDVLGVTLWPETKVA